MQDDLINTIEFLIDQLELEMTARGYSETDIDARLKTSKKVLKTALKKIQRSLIMVDEGIDENK